MPYIKKEDRQYFDETIKAISEDVANEGDLNYIFTSLLHDRIEVEGISYQTLNNLIGVLECCKLELYRVLVGPYEDTKKKLNGSVSDLDK